MEYKYDSQTINPRNASCQHCNGNASVHFATSLLTVNCQLSTVTWIHTFSAKEKDTETGLSYFGSRYYSSDLSIWLSVDPMSDKYASLSPYVYCANNPIKLVDPNGEEIGDYYSFDGTYLGSDGENDNKVYQQSEKGDVTFGLGVLKQTSFEYLGDVNETKLEYSGEMQDNGHKSTGNLDVIQIVENNTFKRASFSAVSGSSRLFTLQNGEYETNTFRDRTKEAMVRDGVGFSINLKPTFQTGRFDLRIHPDGNQPGTEGCIGLTGNASTLRDFVKIMRPLYEKNNTINLSVKIKDNPNYGGM